MHAHRAAVSQRRLEIVDLLIGELEIRGNPNLAFEPARNSRLRLLEYGDEPYQRLAVAADNDLLAGECALDEAGKRGFRHVHVDDFAHRRIILAKLAKSYEL